MIRLRAFFRHQRGSATIEFAFASLFLFGIIMVSLDFAMYAQQNLKLGSAVEQGAIIAFKQGASGLDQSTIGNYVSATVGGSPTMSYQCNGGTCSGTNSKCIGAPTAAGGWPTFTAATVDASGNATCANGAAPGYYLVIRAQRTYQSVVVPDRYLNGGTMQQQAVVRLS